MLNYSDFETLGKLSIILMIVEPFTFEWFVSLGVGAFVIHFFRQVYSTFFAKRIKKTMEYTKKKILNIFKKENERK